MSMYGDGDNYLLCGFGSYNTCAWTVSKVVRTYGDFLLLAQKALDIAAKNTTDRYMKFDEAVSKAAADTLNKQQVTGAANLTDSSGARYFPPPSTGTTVASLFGRLKKLVAIDPIAAKLVTDKAAEYYKNVEQKAAGAAAAAAPAAPAFQPSVASYAPAAAPALPVSAPAAAEEPFYKRPWFAPVAVLGTVGIAAFFLLPKRGA